MSVLFGVWQLTGCPLSEADIERTAAQPVSGPILRLQARGVLMIESGGAATSNTVPAIAAPHCKGTLCIFDGRLDNRGELLERFGQDLSDDASNHEIAQAAYDTCGGQGLAALIRNWNLAI